MNLDDGQRQELFEYLLLTRRFEERVLEEYEDSGIPELPHLSTGQEAVGVGMVYALEGDDWVAPSLRTRAAILMRIPLRQIVAGMYGTVSGPSEGRTTQHHMGDTDRRILGTTGLVGSHLNVAAGAGLASDRLDQSRVTAVLFGDGATTRGEFHTALNFSAIQDLPVVFVIENNGYSEETPIDEVVAVDDLVNFAGHDLPKHVVDGQDVEEMVAVVGESVERARSGEGPTLIEAKTYRFRPHAEVIEERRPKTERERWADRDPVETYRRRLLEADVIDEAWLEGLEADLADRIEDAFEYAADDPMPDEEVMYHVYKDTDVDRDGRVIR